MKYTLYKPNSKNTGAAFSFECSRDKNNKPSLFVSMIQQYSWNDSTKNGSFKENAKNPEKSSIIKINEIEAGEFISSFKARIPFIAFHKNDDATTIIKLSPWDKDRKIKEQGNDTIYKAPCWGITVTKNSSQVFKLPLEAGEAEVLSELFKRYIQECLEFEGAKRKNNYSQAPQKQPQEQTPNKTSYSDEQDDVPF